MPDGRTDPISVQVARLRGCTPIALPAGDVAPARWRCACPRGHGWPEAYAVLHASNGPTDPMPFEAWLQPGAAWLLLSEIARRCAVSLEQYRDNGRVIGAVEAAGWPLALAVGGKAHGDELALAVARAWVDLRRRTGA